MRNYSVDEINTFMRKLENPQILIAGCTKFHKIESRDMDYYESLNTILENPNHPPNVIRGIEQFLIKWMKDSFYKFRKSFIPKLKKRIEKVYKETEEDFYNLKDQKLETIDLEDTDIKDRITRIFNNFSDEETIKFTGASKAIHLILPELFMMYDVRIRRNYYKIQPYYRWKALDEASFYIEFMKIMQNTAQKLLQKRTKEQLWKMHVQSADQLDQDPKFSVRLSIYPRVKMDSVPKMLDECNWVKFYKEIDFGPIA